MQWGQAILASSVGSFFCFCYGLNLVKVSGLNWATSTEFSQPISLCNVKHDWMLNPNDGYPILAFFFCIQKELCSNHFYMYIMCRPGLFQQVNILIKIVCKNWFRSTGLTVCVPVCTWGKESCPKQAWSREKAPCYAAVPEGLEVRLCLGGIQGGPWCWEF